MIREYQQTDLDVTAQVWRRSGQAEYHYLSAFQALDENSAKDVFRRVIEAECKIRVFESSTQISGFIAMNENLIDRLYVDPQHQGSGIGSRLLDDAKKRYTDGLVLKTHQQNTRARAFYEKRGFRAVSFGLSPPPESMPDIEYRWSRG